MSTTASVKVCAHMEPYHAAMVAALAEARGTSISKVAMTLISGSMHRRGWRELSELEVEREDQLRDALHALDEMTVRAFIPTLPRNGPRSPLMVFMTEADFAILCRINTSRSNAARSMIEDALAYLLEPLQGAEAAVDLERPVGDAERVAKALTTISDPQLRQSLVEAVERMALLCRSGPGIPADLADA